MLRKRIIPRILVRKAGDNFSSVVSRKFDRFITVGNPISQFKIMDSNKADEISIINLHRGGLSTISEFSSYLQGIVKVSSTPISAGGGIKSYGDVDILMESGIEKLSIPIYDEFSNLSIFEYVARKYGKQAVQGTLDYSELDSFYSVRRSIKRISYKDLINLIKKYIESGAGEIVLTNIERDGARQGLDLGLLPIVDCGISAPILLSGGAHSADNFVDAFNKGADGVISGTYLAKMDQNLLQLRSKVSIAGVNVRSIN
jgi:cyclase